MPVEPVPCAPGGEGSPAECGSAVVLPLCDQTPGGECVPFLRHLTHDCDGQVTGQTDTATDGVTPYTPQGTVGSCEECPCEDATKVLPLCDYQPDGTSIPFLRHVTYDCASGQITGQTDTELDASTPYTPTGEVGECGQCRPVPMCPQLIGLSGPEVWEMPEGTESVSLNVACGPVTVTDCAGNATVINECGTGFQWAAPPADCRPGTLCTPFTVDVPPGSAAYLTFLTPCTTGDAS